MTKLYTDPFGPPWRMQWLRLLFTWGGSIFQFFWIEWLFSTLLCTAFVLIWFSIWDGKALDELGDAAQAFLSAVSYMATRFQAALSLMLGFYTSTIFGRWWKVRECEGVAIGRINDIAVQIAGFIRENRPSNETAPFEDQTKSVSKDEEFEENKADFHDAVESINTNGADEAPSKDHTAVVDANDVRLTLVRWLNLSHALTVGELYEKKPNEFTSLENIRDFGLLTDAEYDYMVRTPRSRYVAPFVWFLDLLHDLKDKGKCGVSEDTIIVFSSNITKIRGSLADLYMYRNVPVPLSYRQLVNFTVRAYLFILAIAGGLSAFEENRVEQTIYVTPAVFWIVLPFFFEYFMFVGWLTVSDALGNPFRTWADEFEWENYVRTVALSSNLFITETHDNSMRLENLRASTESLQQKKAEIFAKWEKGLEADDDVFTGYHDFTEGRKEARKSKVMRGKKKIRKGLTGY